MLLTCYVIVIFVQGVLLFDEDDEDEDYYEDEDEDEDGVLDDEGEEGEQ
jgi:hypothetical protein